MERKRLSALLDALKEGIFEKDHVMSLALLAAVAGEGIFLLGPPGVAKSLVARRMKSAFRGGKSFEYLMSRFSTPDEIFGPVSVSALKDENRYVRMTEGYLPTADVVFLDEIWKAGPSIQNALLTVLNEKVYLNGNEEQKLPLKLIVAASNELPAEGEGLEALWDRFLVRCVVGGIQDRQLFNRMISAPVGPLPEVEDELRLSDEELSVWDGGIDAVQVPDYVFTFVHALRALLAAYEASGDSDALPFYVSDRRWKKMVRLWRASAFMNGRSEVHWSDLLLVSDCLWDAPAQEKPLNRLLADALVQAVEDRIGLPLLSERFEALKEDGGGTAEASVPFKVVKTFFYQVQSLYPGRTVLVYVSEYEALERDVVVPFVLVDDRRKTGAQILRKYDKARFPGVFPKDLLQVSRTATGLKVNGRAYDLLCDAGAESVNGSASRSADNVAGGWVAAMSQRVAAELDEAAARLEEIGRSAAERMQEHLFLNDGQQRLWGNVLKRVAARISSMQIESKELSHAMGKG